MAIYFYKQYGELGYLANYSEHGFYKDGKYWPTAEHYYQAQKFFSEELKETIRNAATAKEAARIGRSRENPLREDWEEVKVEIMYVAILCKFKAHSDIKEKLLNTGEEEIIEHTVDEYFWGCGKDKSGKNVYGKLLMRVRDTLRKEKGEQ